LRMMQIVFFLVGDCGFSNSLKFSCFKKETDMRKKYTKDELIERLKTYQKTLGRVPKSYEVKTPCSSTYAHYFGTFNEALEAAELTPLSRRTRRYEKAELVERLNVRAKELGRVPIGIEMENPGVSAYIISFGSWQKALDYAGLTKTYTERDLLEILQDEYEQTGEPPIYENQQDPCAYIFCKQFGTWGNALRKAGIHPCKPRYTDEELLAFLVAVAREEGRIPRILDMNTREEMPSGTTYIRRFGSWKKALKIAGLNKAQ